MKLPSTFFCMSLIAMSQQARANGLSVVQESDEGQSSATIVQTTPGEKSAEFDVKSGPGYVIVRQRSSNSRAVIIQGQTPKEK